MRALRACGVLNNSFRPGGQGKLGSLCVLQKGQEFTHAALQSDIVRDGTVLKHSSAGRKVLLRKLVCRAVAAAVRPGKINKKSSWIERLRFVCAALSGGFSSPTQHLIPEFRPMRRDT
ncbi:hypothetical protein HRR77_004567 [Exophiala dermatitidis]|nr:hypothetical protein HRR77_004567 [Exophiala dermatitidis]KAJ4573608.1 hypothetical protein HRR79_002623 [Exophiala dermatitidis]KAJ4623548.1 hypothetical protein HRR85_000413 [Exophiala dermatitidis]